MCIITVLTLSFNYRNKIILILILYNTLILTHYNYCILSWGSILRENLHLHLSQKKCSTNNDK